MVKGYETYCLADALFYDTPASIPRREPDFAAAERPMPDGWKRGAIDDWVMCAPRGHELPPQGWKIHASACLDDAEAVVDAVWEYCVPRGIAFKFIPSRRSFFVRNLKYSSRGASGKLVTIYPADDAEFERIVTELAPLVEGHAGPYILSDLRIGAGPLYVRYGGFIERYCINEAGEQELAIADGDGNLVPDRRGPTFQLPPWLELPAFLEPHLAARNSVKVDELPCTVESALHFSNSGGVYAGTDKRTGERVVLKEARPHAGLAMDGSDAVARLQRERATLERLAGLDAVPTLHDYFVAGEHHFLMQSFVEGESVHTCLARRSPLVLQELLPEAADEHAAWSMDICGKVERAVAAVHERGLAILDVHPSNILVGPDGEVTLIDLEMATDLSDPRSQTLADPSFMAPRGMTGAEVDRYALACLRIYVFLPLTSLFGMRLEKAWDLAEAIGELFPTAREFVAEAARTIAGPVQETTRSHFLHGWEEAREGMTRAILASATPERNDRLFPGDIQQFASGGLNLAWGAAGVLYALHATGAGRHPAHEEWLVSRALDPPAGSRFGLYDGLHGVAYVLERLGREEEALAVLDRCRSELRGKLGHFGLDMIGGASGIGLNLLHFADVTGDGELLDEAVAVAEMVAERLGDEDSVPTVSGGEHPYAGLTRGSSGPAVLFIKHYDRTGDERWLDLAATAIRQDLRRCIIRPEDGALEVDEGWRSCPYLADGGVGIGFALQDYLARRDDEAFRDSLATIRRSATPPLCLEPGVLYGRGGMLLFLTREHPPGTAVERDPFVAAHVERLAWHAIPFGGGMAFPGEQLMRLSMDLASGTAGVLLAVASALHDEPVHLPFLERPVPGRRDQELVATTSDGRR